MSDSRDVAVRPATQNQAVSIFSDGNAFEHAQRIAKMLSSSDLVPTNYKDKVANTLVALSIAARTNSDPLMVMQNLNIIHGRPSWSSQFIIAALNSCGRFSSLRFRVEGKDDAKSCTAVATDLSSGEILEGPPVTIEMAKKEGWFTKNGSKWQTMPDLMLRYRSAAFFGRLYAPDVLMGMQAADEVEDVGHFESVPAPSNAVVTELNSKIVEAAKPDPAPKKRREPIEAVIVPEARVPAKETAPEPTTEMAPAPDEPGLSPDEELV